MKTENLRGVAESRPVCVDLNFADSPPFGSYDIFNKTIGLASYKSYDDYRLFDSLETVRLKDSGIHVYVGKVQASTKSTTDKKKFYNLWFIFGLTSGRGANRDSVLSAYCKCEGGTVGVSTSLLQCVH